MKQRPEHAQDCPACDKGWTASGILCMRCTDAVIEFDAGLYPAFMKHRAEHARLVAHDAGGLAIMELAQAEACLEAYFRGVIVGTARVLSEARTQQHAAWQQQKKNRRTKP